MEVIAVLTVFVVLTSDVGIVMVACVSECYC